MSRRGWLLFLALCVIWGVPYLLIRVAVADLDPVFVVFARTLLGGLILLPIALKQRSLMPVFKRWRVLLVYTLVEICGPWLLLGHAEQRLTSSTAGLLIAMVPLFAALLAWFTGGEKLSGLRWGGLALGFAGVVTLAGLDINVSDLASVGAIVLTAIGYAIGPVIISRKLADLQSSGVVTASLLLAALIYAPIVPFFWPASIPADAGWSVVGLAVICTAIAFMFLFALIAEAGPARSTVITYVNPAVAILLGVLVLNEPLTAGMLIGFPLVLLGSILATSRSRAPKDPTTRPDDLPAISRDRPGTIS